MLLLIIELPVIVIFPNENYAASSRINILTGPLRNVDQGKTPQPQMNRLGKHLQKKKLKCIIRPEEGH